MVLNAPTADVQTGYAIPETVPITVTDTNSSATYIPLFCQVNVYNLTSNTFVAKNLSYNTSAFMLASTDGSGNRTYAVQIPYAVDGDSEAIDITVKIVYTNGSNTPYSATLHAISPPAAPTLAYALRTDPNSGYIIVDDPSSVYLYTDTSIAGINYFLQYDDESGGVMENGFVDMSSVETYDASGTAQFLFYIENLQPGVIERVSVQWVYYYNGDSYTSNLSGTLAFPATATPPPPNDVAAELTLNYLQTGPAVLVTWLEPYYGNYVTVDGYYVYRSTTHYPVTTDAYTQIADVPQSAGVDGAFSYLDETVLEDVTYYYFVVSYFSTGEMSVPTPEDALTVSIANPDPVTNVIAALTTPVSNLPCAAVSWTAPANIDAVPIDYYYVVQYKNGVFDASYNVSSPSVSMNSNALSTNSTYYFTVMAVTYSGAEASAVSSNSISTTIDPPTSVAASIGTPNAGYVVISTSWTAPANSATVPDQTISVKMTNGSTTYTYSAAGSATSLDFSSNIVPGTTYTIWAVANAYDSNYSVDSSSTTLAIPDVQPATSVSAALTTAGGDNLPRITVSWTGSSGVSQVPVNYYTVSQYLNGATLPNSTTNVSYPGTSATFSALATNASYTYKVVAVAYSGAAQSSAAYSGSVSTTVAPPTGLSSSLIAVSASAPISRLSWTAPADTANIPVQYIKVNFTDRSGSWLSFNVSGSTTSVDLSNIAVGTTYSAYLNSIAYDSNLSVNTSTDTLVVPMNDAVQNLQNSYTINTNIVALSWSAGANYSTEPPEYYKIYITGGAYSGYLLTTIAGSSTSWSTDGTTVIPGYDYTFDVYSIPYIDPTGTPVYEYATTSINIDGPLSPIDLSGNYDDSTKNITITWAAPTPSDNITGYKVYRQTGSGSLVLITSPSSSTFTYTDVGPFTNGSYYTYYVSSTGANGSESASVSVTLGPVYLGATAPTSTALVAYNEWMMGSFVKPTNLYGLTGDHYVVTIYDAADDTEPFTTMNVAYTGVTDVSFEITADAQGIANDTTYYFTAYLVTMSDGVEVNGLVSSPSNNATTSAPPIIVGITNNYNSTNGRIYVEFISNCVADNGERFTPFSRAELMYPLSLFHSSSDAINSPIAPYTLIQHTNEHLECLGGGNWVGNKYRLILDIPSLITDAPVTITYSAFNVASTYGMSTLGEPDDNSIVLEGVDYPAV